MKGRTGQHVSDYYATGVISFVLGVLLAWACTSTPQGPGGTSFFDFRVEDASCTEVWLRITMDSSIQPRTLTVRRDTFTVVTTTLASTETLIVDEGLLASRTYLYTAVRPTGFGTNDSLAATASTMDSTSHEFVWQIDTLGDCSSSVLRDVVIINDTLAYAVGDIYLRDSMGNCDPNAYNVAKWNGTRWELMRVQFYTICGQTSRTPYPASAVIAFGPTDVWIAMDGDQVARWNGNSQTATMCMPVSFSIYRLWGEDPSAVYAAGDGGNLLRYDGSVWSSVESGTTIDIHDIVGRGDSFSEGREIIAVASNWSFPEGSKILSIQGTTVSELSNSGLPGSLDGIWFQPKRRYIVVGDGLYYTRSPQSVWVREAGLPPLYKTCISGIGLNEIVVGGAFWNLLHYNGTSWRSYFPGSPGSFTAIEVKGNQIIAVGGASGRAIVVRGMRQP